MGTNRIIIPTIPRPENHQSWPGNLIGTMPRRLASRDAMVGARSQPSRLTSVSPTNWQQGTLGSSRHLLLYTHLRAWPEHLQDTLSRCFESKDAKVEARSPQGRSSSVSPTKSTTYHATIPTLFPLRTSRRLVPNPHRHVTKSLREPKS